MAQILRVWKHPGDPDERIHYIWRVQGRDRHLIEKPGSFFYDRLAELLP